MSDLGPPSVKEVEAVFSASPEKRVHYFFTRTALSGELWIIFSEDTILELKNTQGGWMLPVWPYREFAENYRERVCQQVKATRALSVSVAKFIREAGKLIEEKHSTIGVFPSTDGTVVELELDEFVRDFKAERYRVLGPVPKF